MTEVIEQIKIKEIEQGKEKRNVPEMRFRGFEDEWEEKKLNNFLKESRIVGSNGDKAKKLTVKLWAKGVVPKKEIYEGSNNTQYYIRKKGQLIYGKLDFLNCAFGIIPDELDGYESTIDSPAFNINNIVPYFLYNKIIQKNFYKKNGDIADGSRKAKRIHQDTFLNMSINVPSLQEQKKIADFLSLVDKKIEKQSEKIEALKTYQKGIIQKIFKQEIRFKDENGREYPEWEEKRLGEFLIPRVEKQIPTKEAPLMAFTSTGGIESKGERYDRSFLVKNHKKLYKRTELNDFIYSSNNLDVGSIGLNKYGTAVISDVYEIFIINNQASLVFISTMIKMPKMLYKIIQYRQGVMYGQYRIHTDNFLKVKDFMPCLEEQIKIANLFNAIDKKIEKEEEKLEELKVWKKGLLQKMFV